MFEQERADRGNLEVRDYFKSLIGYFISMPSLSRNNAAMRLPYLMDGVPIYGRVKQGFKLRMFLGKSAGNC